MPSWGDPQPRLVIVGLAPGLKGANRTGRPFTGDYAGTLLFSTLIKFGLATGVFEARPDDSLRLEGALIVNAVRCVPPQNKPLPSEIATCRQFLIGAIEAHPARVYLALGRIAHEALLTGFGERAARFPFAHGAEHLLPSGALLFDSYHCSRQNTNTGRLTVAMLLVLLSLHAHPLAAAVAGGRHAHAVPEDAVEVAEVVDAAAEGDVDHRSIRQAQLAGGMGHAEIVYELRRAASGDAAQGAVEVFGRAPRESREPPGAAHEFFRCREAPDSGVQPILKVRPRVCFLRAQQIEQESIEHEQ